MKSAVSVPRTRVPWAQRVRDSDQDQRQTANERQTAPSYEPKRIEYIEEGSTQPRGEAWFVHRYQRDGVLRRTRVIANIELQLLLRLPHKFELDPVNVRQLLLKPQFKGWTVSRVLLQYEQFSKDALRAGFEHIDEMRENQRPRRYVASEMILDPDAPLLEAEAPVIEVEDREPTQMLGMKATSKPHAKNELRGRFIRCTPYRGEDVGRTIDPMEQWIAVVDTDQGQFHLVDVDLQRAFEVSGARQNDVIRIVKRNSQTSKTQLSLTEERHGTHGDGAHKSTITRDDVYDVYIEKKTSTYGDDRRNQKPPASKAEKVLTTGPLPEALHDIKPEGEVLREVLRHINDRSIIGWTKIVVAEQPQVHVRLLSCSPEDHLALFVRSNECVARYVYPETLESVQRRLRLRLPDLVIRPA